MKIPGGILDGHKCHWSVLVVGGIAWAEFGWRAIYTHDFGMAGLCMLIVFANASVLAEKVNA